MSANRTTTDQNAAPTDTTEDGPTDQDDQGVIVTAQPPRSEEDAKPADAGQEDREFGREHEGPLPASPTPQDRDATR